MDIAPKTVATLKYTLKNSAGQILDKADSEHPFIYLHQPGNIIPGLESELEGKKAGDTLTTIIPPEKAYGIRNESLLQVINKEMFAGMDESQLHEGAQFNAQTDQGMEIITIVKVDNNTITIDANHPLAGETLHFDIEVIEVREATEEELAHGHAHASGSCGHDHPH